MTTPFFNYLSHLSSPRTEHNPPAALERAQTLSQEEIQQLNGNVQQQHDLTMTEEDYMLVATNNPDGGDNTRNYVLVNDRIDYIHRSDELEHVSLYIFKSEYAKINIKRELDRIQRNKSKSARRRNQQRVIDSDISSCEDEEEEDDDDTTNGNDDDENDNSNIASRLRHMNEY